MGSKARISKYIVPLIQNELKENTVYIEPFAGGMNLMQHIMHKQRIANDINNYLIAMWRYIQNGYEFPKHISRETYSEYRDIFNRLKFNSDSTSETAALIGWYGFMGSFNGRFFDGGYSGHDVHGRDYIGENIRNTLSQREYLTDVVFKSDDYKNLVIPQNAVIYCDIPYRGTKQYSTSKNFDYESFYTWCRDTAAKGAKIFLSEYNAPADFNCIWSKEITNALNQKKTYKPIEKLYKIFNEKFG